MGESSSMESGKVEKRWVLAPEPCKKRVEELRHYLRKDGRPFSAPLAKLLLQRGIGPEEARSFFLPSLDDLHDPFSMKDMEVAVERLTESVFGEERIMVLGDYDVDGTTAVAMMTDFLRELGKEPIVHVPDRYEEGYGISELAIDRAIGEGVGLIIALDCGIKGHAPVGKASDAGIATIVCDHHRPDETLPPARAVLDPQRQDDRYPYKGLSGCGVGFKLLQAFSAQHDIDPGRLHPYLDLLAISIAADIVPMTDENRILTHFGLKRIEEAPRPGIRALKEKAGIGEGPIDVTRLVFTLGPRINAAGRMDHGERAVELLSADEEGAAKGSDLLDGHNNERKDMDKRITQEALERIRTYPEEESAYSTVVHAPDWHKGVIGIVASRLLDHYHRPTIVLTGSGEEVTGSARSVQGFDIHAALSSCSDYLKRFGGHRYAAGMTLREADLPAFREAFEAEVARSIRPEQLVPELGADLELPLKRIDARFFHTLQRFGPFGPENMKPVFLTRHLLAETVKGVGKDKEHLKMRVYQEEDPGSRFPAIAFGAGSLYPRILEGERFHILYHIEMNEFKGKRNIQLRVLDIKFGAEEEVLAAPSQRATSLP
jgi:single-stranded-DNA-specific exonuclease